MLQERGPQALPAVAARQGAGDLSIHHGAAAAGQVAAPSAGGDGRSSARGEISTDAVRRCPPARRPRATSSSTTSASRSTRRWARQARATMAAVPNYRWLGGLPHEAVRRRIQRAHLLVHASRIEGGAHVIMEAVASGTPVLASAVDGNVGMLGADYAGYFPWNDAEALATLLLRCRESARRRRAAAGSGEQPLSAARRRSAGSERRCSRRHASASRCAGWSTICWSTTCEERTECSRRRPRLPATSS